MHLTPKIQKAINIAAEKHLGQVRKGDGLPYIVHPFAVAWILSGYTNDEDVICAGLLHDCLEDVPDYRFDDLAKDFGEKIASIVKEVSEDKDPNIKTDEKATWLTRKNKYLEHLRIASQEAMLVCGADKINNIQSMLTAYKNQGSSLLEKFNTSFDKILWFNSEVLKILEEKLNNPLVAELKTVYEQLKKETT